VTLGDILVVAPHPDDETLGAGGTLLRAREAGHRIHWLLLTAAAAEKWGDAYVDTQRSQVEAVRKAFPFDTFSWWGVPASGLARANTGELVDRLRDTLGQLRPETVIVPHAGDAHDDHGAAFAVATAAAKSFRMPSFGVRRVMAMDILSETDAAPPVLPRSFLPTISVDIGAQLGRKLEILRLYASETLPGTPRTLDIVEAHARVCGAAVGIVAAERFMLVRELI
jgi:LmbE family N-acetylglucosaminyl deacetylase